MQSRRAVAVLLAVAAFPCLSPWAARSAHGDGGFVPERAYPKLPAIPSQRALLRYRDGVETLIIESSLDGEGQKFGWIIPLPAEPTGFGKASPGLLRTLSICLQPGLTHDLGLFSFGKRSFVGFFVLTCFVAITAFGLVAIVSKLRTLARTIVLLLTLAALALVLPAFGTAGIGGVGRATEIQGVDVKKRVRIGSYDLAVLTARSADALDAWLTRNGFAKIPPAGQPVVSDYAREGWGFVAAKLSREGEGFSTPHPLLMSFPAERPVYPMRLTALAGSKLRLELFVVAEGRAHCDTLDVEYCDVYRDVQRPADPSPSRLRMDRYLWYRGKTFRQRIAHPAAKQLLWPGCVVTKLSRHLTPRQMERDFVLEFREFRPFRRHRYSHYGASQTGVGVAVAIWCIGLLLAVNIKQHKIRGDGGRRYGFRRIVLPLFCLSVLAGGTIYLLLPKVAVARGGRWRFDEHAHKVIFLACRVVSENPGILQSDADTIAQYLAKSFEAEGIRNPFTDSPMLVEDSPGNFTVVKTGSGFGIRAFLPDGRFRGAPLQDGRAADQCAMAPHESGCAVPATSVLRNWHAALRPTPLGPWLVGEVATMPLAPAGCVCALCGRAPAEASRMKRLTSFRTDVSPDCASEGYCQHRRQNRTSGDGAERPPTDAQWGADCMREVTPSSTLRSARLLAPILLLGILLSTGWGGSEALPIAAEKAKLAKGSLERRPKLVGQKVED